MALAVWPATLPQSFLVEGFTANRMEARSVFQPEKGPAIRRRGLILPFRIYRGGLEPALTQTLVGTLEDFYEDDLAEGTLPFTFPLDPLDGTTNIIVRIEGVIEYQVIGFDHYRPSMTLMRLP